ncbi:hypothetical protein LCGC14_2041050, partial [marine sediment metagenome]
LRESQQTFEPPSFGFAYTEVYHNIGLSARVEVHQFSDHYMTFANITNNVVIRAIADSP